MEKAIEMGKKSNLELKTHLQKFSDEVEEREKEMAQQLSRTRHNLSQSKKTIQ